MATTSPEHSSEHEAPGKSGDDGVSSTAARARDPRSGSNAADEAERQSDPESDSDSEEGEADEEEAEESSRTHRRANDAAEQGEGDKPPLPDEAPPLPVEPQPSTTTAEVGDGWQPVWDATAQAYYFYNAFTQATTWTNPRLPPGAAESNGATADGQHRSVAPAPPPYGGYDPSIHGDYDPTAPYAQDPSDPAFSSLQASGAVDASSDPAADYTTSAHFSRFSSRFVNPNDPAAAAHLPDHHDDEHKSRRQMSAFFDVDAAANSHDGRSLRAERQGKRLTKKELKAFKEKRKSRKEEKRRAWLKD